MKNIRKLWTSLTSSGEAEERSAAAARSLHSEMFKSMGSLGSILTLTTRASSREEEEVQSQYTYSGILHSVQIISTLTPNLFDMERSVQSAV